MSNAPIPFPRRPRSLVPASEQAVVVQAGPVALRRNRRAPIVAGLSIIGVFVVGLLLWTAFASVSGAVAAPAVVRVQSNLKTIKHLEGGRVRTIGVRDGQRVSAGQVLMTFDPLQSESQNLVLRNQYDTALAERARFEAELRGADSVVFPAELLARRGDPMVEGIITDQESLFLSRRDVLRSQTEVLEQRIQQLETRIEGSQAQVDATREQAALIGEELQGLRTLHERGYAPKTRLLALERTAAGLGGRRGELISSISESRERIGESRISILEARQKRQAEAAEGRTNAQERVAELLPRLRVAENTLTNTQVRAPVDGFVINLTQFTEGGVAAAGETLMDIVPFGAPLIVDASVKPQDIEQISIGQEARVRLSAYRAERVPPVKAEVINVSADRLADERTGDAFFRVTLRIDPEDLRRVGAKVRLAPGMPADAMIVTEERSILNYLLQPLRDTVGTSLRET